MDFSLFSLMNLTVYSHKGLSLRSHFVSYWRVTASEYDLFNEPTGRWIIQGYQRERREYVPISTKMSGIGYPIPQRTDRLLRSFMKFSSFNSILSGRLTIFAYLEPVYAPGTRTESIPWMIPLSASISAGQFELFDGPSDLSPTIAKSSQFLRNLR